MHHVERISHLSQRINWMDPQPNRRVVDVRFGVVVSASHGRPIGLILTPICCRGCNRVSSKLDRINYESIGCSFHQFSANLSSTDAAEAPEQTYMPV